MPNKKPTRGSVPRGSDLPDEMILAALERADLHAYRKPGVLFSTLKEHLGLPRGSGSGRILRPRIRALQAEKLVQQAKMSGCEVWMLTDEGHAHLEAARQAHQLLPLPESPQHRKWREARDQAKERIGEFRERLLMTLKDAEALLAASSATSSDDWFLLGERMGEDCSRLGSATYCLSEWAEPNDTTADLEQGYQHGRRETPRW